MRHPALYAVVLALAVSAASMAFAGTGQPSPWQMDLQGSATLVHEHIHSFHWFLLVIITVVTLFVLALLIYVAVRFNEKANPTPSTTTHHVGLEVAWTVVPVLILVVIAVPSFRLLFEELTIPKADLVLKVTGKQWFWTFDYPDHKITFDSVMLQDKERRADQPRLLAVDNAVVVPINKNVVLHVTAADVLHAITVPSFGIKIDAVTGRLNQTWFKAEKEGVYYGQCSELCGKDHAFMPVEFHVVSEAKYNAWLAEAKKKFAQGLPPTPVRDIAVLESEGQVASVAPAPAR